MEDIAIGIVSIFSGIVVGSLAGLIGVGGGTIMVPLFRLGFGLDVLVATGTSLFAIVPTAMSAALGHIRSRTSVVHIGLIAGFFGAIVSPLGVQFADHSPSWLVMLVTAVVMIYTAGSMLIKVFRSKRLARLSKIISSETVSGDNPDLANADASCNSSIKSHKVFTPTDLKFKKFYMLAAGIGVIAGLLAGYVGVGGGFLMIPLMMNFMNMPFKNASGTSLTAVSILSIPALITQLILGNVNFIVGVCICLGSIPGAQLGAWLSTRISDRVLRICFSIFLVVMAVILVGGELF